MNIKIQGGGSGTYANTGSCTGVTTYLQHEDLERMKNGREVQPFFNNSRDYISAQEVTFKIDNNKAKLSRNDAKFYVITVSPSSRELEKMGKTEKEQAEAMRRYVRDDVMQRYAEGFGKGLNKEDIEYYGKIQISRRQCWLTLRRRNTDILSFPRWWNKRFFLLCGSGRAMRGF